jgi:hypothetical protein
MGFNEKFLTFFLFMYKAEVFFVVANKKVFPLWCNARSPGPIFLETTENITIVQIISRLIENLNKTM